MELPLINIIIRTSNRAELFHRCYQSIKSQTYKNIQVIVGYDNPVALNYIPLECIPVKLYPAENHPFFYDLYCNQLKQMVAHGWFLFLDDDDFLYCPRALEDIAEYLKDDYGAIVCQMLRNGIPKPRSNYMRQGIIEEGKIGLPCIIVHSSFAHVGQLDGYAGGDYRYIKQVTQQVPTRFVPLIVVETDRRSRGKMG